MARSPSAGTTRSTGSLSAPAPRGVRDRRQRAEGEGSAGCGRDRRARVPQRDAGGADDERRRAERVRHAHAQLIAANARMHDLAQRLVGDLVGGAQWRGQRGRRPRANPLLIAVSPFGGGGIAGDPSERERECERARTRSVASLTSIRAKSIGAAAIGRDSIRLLGQGEADSGNVFQNPLILCDARYSPASRRHATETEVEVRLAEADRERHCARPVTR